MNNLKKTTFLIVLLFVSHCGKEDNKVKFNSILLFGDSLMSGYGLQEEQHLSIVLENNLKLEGHKIKVSSQSISGDTTLDGLDRVENIFSDAKPLIIPRWRVEDIDTVEDLKNAEIKAKILKMQEEK